VVILLLFRVQPIAAGCIIAGSAAVLLMQFPLFSESWNSFCRPRKDERWSTQLVLFNSMTGTQTQDPKIAIQPP